MPTKRREAICRVMLRASKSTVLSVLFQNMADYAAEVYSASCLRDLSSEPPVRRLLGIGRTQRTA